MAPHNQHEILARVIEANPKGAMVLCRTAWQELHTVRATFYSVLYVNI